MAELLILTPRFPYPIEAGDTLRIHHMCKELAQHHSLTLLSLCATEEEMTTEPPAGVYDHVERVYHPFWRAMIGMAGVLFTGEPLQVGYYRSGEFQRKVDALRPRHDLTLAHLVRTAQYVQDEEKGGCVLEMTDALSLNYARVVKERTWDWKSMIYRFERPRMETYEQEAVNTFDLVTLVSDVDREFLVQRHGGQADHIRVVTNGIDLDNRPYSDPSPASPPVMAFIGNMRTVHNRDACRYIASEVLPLVRAEIPGATFRIIGAAEDQDVRSLDAITGVEVTGWVDSIPAAANDALCGMGVMRLGAGLQNKVLEYMAIGLPVVANKRGLEGIIFSEDRPVLTGETARDVADAVIRLYHDEQLRQSLARRAREVVTRNHRWDAAMKPLIEDVDQLLQDIDE